MRRVLVLTVATLVVLELVLQLATLFVWLTHRRASPAPAAAGEQVVLCIGDSYTFGLGASSPDQSYPAQLERELARRGTPVRVVNAGWPGRHLGELLETVAAGVVQWRPSRVFVLAGTNDLWRRPALTDVPAIGRDEVDAFAWAWRTGRLAAWITDRLTESTTTLGAPVEAASDVVLAGKVWFDGSGSLLHFHDGGLLETRFGDAWWQQQDGRVEIAIGGTAAGYAVERDGAAVRLRSLDGHADLVLAPLLATPLEPPAPSARAHALQIRGELALAAGRTEEADAAFAAARALLPDDPRVLAGLLGLELFRGRNDAARHVADELVAIVDGAPLTEERALQAVSALQKIGAHRELLARTARYVEQFPASAPLRVARGFALLGGESMPDAIAAFEAAEGLAGADRATALEACFVGALVLAPIDPDRALSAFVRGLRHGPEPERIAEIVRLLEMGAGRAWIEERLPSVAASTAELERARAAVRAALADTDDPERILALHLERLAAFCQGAGAARVTFLTYPFRNARHERAVRAACAATGCDELRITDVFEELLRSGAKTRAELFVADGHCTDAGYAVLARAVADACAPAAGAASR